MISVFGREKLRDLNRRSRDDLRACECYEGPRGCVDCTGTDSNECDTTIARYWDLRPECDNDEIPGGTWWENSKAPDSQARGAQKNPDTSPKTLLVDLHWISPVTDGWLLFGPPQ